MDVSRLSKLFEAGTSGVKKFTKTLSVPVDKSHKDNWSLGAVIFLNSKLQHYFEGFDGVLLGYEDVSVKSTPSEIDAEIDLCHVTIQAKFYVFEPEVGRCISGKVAFKKKSSIVVAVHDYLQINCLLPKNLKNLVVGAQVSVKITSLVWVSGRPNMLGEMEKMDNTVTTLTSPTTSLSVKGLSSPVKRKSEALEKPKKTKRTNSQDEGGTTTTEIESNNEKRSPPKTPTPKAPKTPGKTHKAQKPLPEGFIVVEKQRSKDLKIDKEYYGPDGKKYRSVAEIYKKLKIDPESVQGESSSQEKISTQEIKEEVEEVEEVVTNWNRGEDGDLAKNRNNFYNSDVLKKLSITEAKSKKGKASKETVEDKGDSEEEAPSSTPLEVRHEDQASVTISDNGDIKKKKKSKKNKGNDKRI